MKKRLTREELQTAKFNPAYLLDGQACFQEKMKDLEFRKAYEQESRRFDIAERVRKEREAQNLSQDATEIIYLKYFCD
ncbi:MAG: hypothetical protein HQK55_12840 [Deltaproteobacteria bacterium]|nr:hypothetical protein [Deltaproteobacteria bacterium]